MKIKRIRGIGWHSLLFISVGLAASFYCVRLPISTLNAQNNDDYVPGEVVVRIQPGTDIARLAADYGLASTPIDQFGKRAIYRMRITDGTFPPVRANQLAYDPMGRVVFAEPNYIEQTPESIGRLIWAHGGGPGEYKGQWAAERIRLSQAHTVTRGAGIVVAVLDTGIEKNHPAFAGRLIAGYDFVDLDSDPSEEGVYGKNLGYGHGTHVAGLVGLAAPDAKIMPVRVLDKDGIGNIWVLAEGLAYAADPDGNPGTSDGAHVINLSLGTRRKTNLLGQLVASLVKGNDDNDGSEIGGNDDGGIGGGGGTGGGDDDDDDGDDGGDDGDGGGQSFASSLVVKKGIVVVAAAGNRASSILEYPAAEDLAGVISVGASTISNRLATFSNWGWWVRVAAPGENVLSSVPGGGYGSWSGTSMSSPLVAGSAALVRAQNPHLYPNEVAQRMVNATIWISGSVPRQIDAALVLGH